MSYERRLYPKVRVERKSSITMIVVDGVGSRRLVVAVWLFDQSDAIRKSTG